MHITTTPFYDIPKQTSNMPWQKGHFNHLFLVAKFTQYTCSSLHIKVVYICKVCYSSSSNQKVWKHQKAIMRIYDSTIPKSVKIRIFWNWVNLKDTNGFNHCLYCASVCFWYNLYTRENTHGYTVDTLRLEVT